MITLYSSPNCPRCKELAAWLTDQGKSFLEKRLLEDLLQDGEVMTDLHLQGISFRAAPVLQVGAVYYNPETLFPGGILAEKTLEALL